MAQPEKLYLSEVVFRFLRDFNTDPAPADLTAMNVDGSVVPKFFDIIAEDDLYINAGTLLVINPNQGPLTFGGLAPLTNGCLIQVLDQNLDLALDLVDTINIKKNADWAFITGTDHKPVQGNSNEEFTANLILSAAGFLYLPEGYRFRIVVRDDLTTITEMRIVIKGQT